MEPKWRRGVVLAAEHVLRRGATMHGRRFLSVMKALPPGEAETIERWGVGFDLYLIGRPAKQ